MGDKLFVAMKTKESTLYEQLLSFGAGGLLPNFQGKKPEISRAIQTILRISSSCNGNFFMKPTSQPTRPPSRSGGNVARTIDFVLPTTTKGGHFHKDKNLLTWPFLLPSLLTPWQRCTSLSLCLPLLLVGGGKDAGVNHKEASSKVLPYLLEEPVLTFPFYNFLPFLPSSPQSSA